MSQETETPQAEQPPEQKKRPKKRRSTLRRRELLVLASIWLVGCAIVGLLLGIFYSQAGRASGPDDAPMPEATFEIDFTGGTAQVAFLLALAHAQEWQDDVRLVSTSAFWRNARVEDLGQADQWDFSFFSTERERVYFAVVSAEDETQGRAHPYKTNRPPLRINPENWLIDSNEALRIWLNQGGGAFLTAFPENEVEALLRQSIDGGGPVWDIIGTSADQSQLFYISVDATTGAVLNRR